MHWKLGTWNSAVIDGGAAEWTDPLPIEALDAPRFPLDALPPVLADMVRDVAAVTQTPPDLAGTMALGVVGAVCSRRVDVEIGRTHVEPLNLYCAAVAASGERKGPALRAMLAPVYALQRKLQLEAKPTVAKATERRRFAEKRLEKLRDQAARLEDAAEAKGPSRGSGGPGVRAPRSPRPADADRQ